MSKDELIALISSWQTDKYSKDYLLELIDENGALNLRQITPEQAKEFYEKNRGERKDERGL